ncbi:BACON domain-containing protein [Thalassotalea marina]|uniref:BACON domain-containing protein n=1 Tax=Thalassotalea marina TaxID=1673741 RepID=A0A919BFL7_9GAMM|nr:BACON domain-containing protein [Thalassotalea marina]GHF85636.1 hypothetical protein GCM10017161_11510 [Thalassotalea marina]
MKEYSIHFIRFTVTLILVLTLQACGGSSNKNSQNFTISANTSEISFSNEFLKVSDDTYQVDVTFNGNGLLLGFAPDSQAVGWLSYSTKNVTATSATVELKVINAENIVPDRYQTKLRLSTGDVNDVNLAHHDIDISLVVWQLTTTQESISFKTTLGEVSPLSQTIDITTDSNNTWTASVDANWLTIDNSQGESEGSVTITADPSAFNQPQLLQASLTLTETTSGGTKIIPVELGIDQHYVFTNQSVIGLTKTRNINVTSQTVTIDSNIGGALNLAVTSNENWLDVEISPNNSDQITITKAADVALNDGLHQATVTVNALNNGGGINQEVASETIQVAYYQTSENTDNQAITEKNITLGSIAVSPYLPHFYTAENNHIATYHVYTGELVYSLSIADESAVIDQLLIHPEGRYLLARATTSITADDGTTSQTVARYKIDLIANSVIELTEAELEYEPAKFISVNGRHFVISQTLEIADENLKRIFWDENNAYFASQIDQAKHAQSIYALDVNAFSFKRYVATVNDFTKQAISLEQTHEHKPSLLEDGQAISSFVADDHDRGLYLVSPTSEWISFDGTTFTDHGLLEQTENATTLNLVKSLNGRAYFLRAAQGLGFYLDLYNASQQLVHTFETNGQQPASLQFSADGSRLIINSVNAQQIELLNVEQLQSSEQNVNFNTVVNAQTPDAQSVTINGLSSEWQLVTSAPWLSVDTAFTGETLTLTLALLDGQLTAPGTYYTQVVVRDIISGASKTITVAVNIDALRFSSNYPALAFNEMANINTLSHTVTILNNRNDNGLSWSATTAANWITLNAEPAQNTLNISADASALTQGIHTATIIISSDESESAQGDEITVTLHKSDEQSEELVINDISVNNDNTRLNTALDPIRPYLYIASGHNINAINIYDGTIVKTVSAPLTDIDLTNLVIHPDGSLLLVSNLETYQDADGQEQSRVNHYKIDLTSFTLTQLPEEQVTINNSYRPMAIVMISGQAVVVTQAQEFADLNLTSLWWQSESAFISNQFYDIKNTDSVLSFNSLNNTVFQYDLNYNSVAETPLTLSNKISYLNTSFNNNIRNISASNDGTNVYSASVLSEWSTFDGTVFTDQGVLYNTPVVSSIRVATDSSDNVYFYRFDSANGFSLAKFNSAQQSLWHVIHTTGSIDTLISPDYQRLISYSSSNNTLSFDTLPD